MANISDLRTQICTIKEVALEARVSTATVSRVLNKTCHVSPSTTAAVLEVVRRLAYTPDKAAAELGRKRTRDKRGKIKRR